MALVNQPVTSTANVGIAWDKSFETGHPGIDTEHRRLIRLLDRLFQIAPAPGDDLMPVLRELQRYATYHFDHESQLMIDHKVSDTHCKAHRLAHEIFVSKLDEAVKQARFDPSSVTSDLLTYLGRWLLTHIMGMDRDLVNEIRQGK